MQDIKELNLKELEDALEGWGFLKFYARQIFAWIYKKAITDFDKMTDLPLDLRRRLKEKFYILSFNVARRLKSKDKTEKFLLQLKDNNLIEAVTIPTEKRITGCISTQVGCKFACRFCASGLLGFKRNLTCGEMIEEVLWLKDKSSHKKLTHLVFMGMGEPLDNYDNVVKAVRIINSDYGFNIGARRITISTCGIIPAIERLAHESLQIELSISLHAADDQTRSMLLPINKKYPIHELIQTCKDYTRRTKRQITFEYVLIKDINSDLQNALKLVTILKNLRLCKVNLIPANPVKEYNIEPPDRLGIFEFRNYLSRHSINVTLRRPRGQDIEAACGQLRLQNEKR